MHKAKKLASALHSSPKPFVGLHCIHEMQLHHLYGVKKWVTAKGNALSLRNIAVGSAWAESAPSSGFPPIVTCQPGWTLQQLCSLLPCSLFSKYINWPLLKVSLMLPLVARLLQSFHHVWCPLGGMFPGHSSQFSEALQFSEETVLRSGWQTLLIGSVRVHCRWENTQRFVPPFHTTATTPWLSWSFA